MNDIRPKNPLQWIKYRYLEWQWDRILHKSGYIFWEVYLRANDPDYTPAGRTVKDQLHGYPYIAVLPSCHLVTKFEPLWGPIENADHIKEWCDKNCRKKYRWHWVRVIQDHAGQYLPVGIGGTDELFFAFKDYSDFITFKMTWS